MYNIQTKIVFAAGLIFWTALIYIQTFYSSFHFDDSGFIVNNPAIRDLANFHAIWKALETPTRFITFVTFAVNFHLHHLDVLGYHLVNFFIHIVNGVLVFWLSCLVLASPSVNLKLTQSKREWIAFWTTFIFLTHPVQTQAVVYITQRFEILAAMFYLGTVCFYLKARMASALPARTGSFVFSGVCALLGVFTKEIVITLPLMIFLVEWLLLKNKNQKQKYFTWLPFIFAAIVLLIPLFYSYRVKSIFLHSIPSESHDGDMITFGTFLLTQARVAITFLRLFFIPIHQNLDYDYPLLRHVGQPDAVLSLLFDFLLIFSAWKLRKKNVVLSFGIFWFLVVFAANCVPRHNLIFEHKSYLMTIGLMLALVVAIVERVKEPKRLQIILVSIVVVLSVLTFCRNRVWRTEVTLWKDVVQKSPNKSRAHLNLGRAYNDVGEYEKALFYYNRSIELDPENRKAYNNRGLIYYRAGNLPLALADFNQAIKLRKNYYEALINRSNVYVAQNQYDLAMADLEFIIFCGANYPMVYANRGSIYAKQKKFNLAINDFNTATDAYFESVELYNNRANAYRFLGQYNKAFEDFDRAIRFNPDFPQTYVFRSEMYNELGQYENAWKDAMKARELGGRLKPQYLQGLEQRLSVSQNN